MKRPTLKVEPNVYPMPGREQWSLNVFAHSVDAMVDVAAAGWPLVAGYAKDHDAISFYRTDDGNYRGELSVYFSSASVGEWLFPDEAREWLKKAKRYCDSGRGAYPASVSIEDPNAVALPTNEGGSND